ncbi:CHAD domain-containing protein [bacterium]|nr:CHAD domain-containing protein [bacterium]
MPAHEAALVVLDSYRKPLLQLDAEALAARDMERLHKFRVALRRTRALLKGMKGIFAIDQIKFYYARLRDLQRITNLIREIDVFILQLPELISALPNTSNTGTEQLLNWLSRKRENAWRGLETELLRDSYSSILTEWFAVLDGNTKPALAEDANLPILDHACQTLSISMSRLIRDAWSINENTPLPELHKTRIRVKVMRYQLEAYLPIMDQKEAGSMRNSLKKIQDKLGEMNDCHMAIRFLSHHRDEVVVTEGEKAELVLDQLIEVLADRFTNRRLQSVQAIREFADEIGNHRDKHVDYPASNLKSA